MTAISPIARALKNKKSSEDTTRVTRSHKLMNNRQYNGQTKRNKRTNNDLQNSIQKSKD